MSDISKVLDEFDTLTFWIDISLIIMVKKQSSSPGLFDSEHRDYQSISWPL
jgi:hypothetical protein